MGKIEGWERLLLAEIERWQHLSFEWGSADCLGFCIACRKALTGQTWQLPAYNSEPGAARQLLKLGFNSVEDLVSSEFQEIAVMRAARGDWVMRDAPGLTPGAFGVVTGRNAAFFSEDGILSIPVIGSIRAWAI
ncbi:hypothetical protein [uncultured Roseobacter sp.]|uniref:DUF6950 family protein n=1 Tax=uncultured Roseobacter sp. TaxID=114847 RepID=UPI0026336F72|nr:hypothetical protein [uncultured Roseobacter sp.]